LLIKEVAETVKKQAYVFNCSYKTVWDIWMEPHWKGDFTYEEVYNYILVSKEDGFWAGGFKMFKKWICKRKGHDFKSTHKEADGWGNVWHWKKCQRCKGYTFDSKPANECENGTVTLQDK
jgi:hypothetical protein